MGLPPYGPHSQQPVCAPQTVHRPARRQSRPCAARAHPHPCCAAYLRAPPPRAPCASFLCARAVLRPPNVPRWRLSKGGAIRRRAKQTPTTVSTGQSCKAEQQMQQRGCPRRGGPPVRPGGASERQAVVGTSPPVNLLQLYIYMYMCQKGKGSVAGGIAKAASIAETRTSPAHPRHSRDQRTQHSLQRCSGLRCYLPCMLLQLCPSYSWSWQVEPIGGNSKLRSRTCSIHLLRTVVPELQMFTVVLHACYVSGPGWRCKQPEAARNIARQRRTCLEHRVTGAPSVTGGRRSRRACVNCSLFVSPGSCWYTEANEDCCMSSIHNV